jgi:hypothetical protein
MKCHLVQEEGIMCILGRKELNTPVSVSAVSVNITEKTSAS